MNKIRLFTLLFTLVFTCKPSHAVKTVMEGIATTNNGVFISTGVPRLLLNTTFYSGAVPNVSLKASSNVVIGSDACVIYATGTVTCLGVVLGGGGGAASTQTVTWVQDNFLGQVNGSQTVFTLSQTPSSSASIFIVLDGILQSSTSDYAYSAPKTITMTTAPASNSTGFFAQYTINTSTLPAVFILNSTNTITAQQTFTSTVLFSSALFHTTLTTTTPSGSISGASFGPCFTASTVTVSKVLSNTEVEVSFEGEIQGNVLNDQLVLTVLMDGGFISPYNASFGMCATIGSTSASLPHNCHFKRRFAGVSSGVHKFCLTGLTASGNITISNSTTMAEFGAFELP